MENSNDKFWVDDPFVLFNKEKIMNLWPNDKMSKQEKWNSITRIVIIMSILGFILRGSVNFVIIGIITLALIILMYKMNKKNEIKEGFVQAAEGNNKLLSIMKPTYYKPTSKNPMSNVLLTEIQDNPNRPEGQAAYIKDNVDEINENAKQMVKEINSDNPDIDKRLFQDLGDNYQFDQSMRSFYTTPATTNPNAQEEFAKFCYGDMPSRKIDNSTNS
jgi:hypothetical protein